MAGHPSSFPPPLHQRPDKVKKCFVQKYGHNFGSMHTQIENPGTKSVALSRPTWRQGRVRQIFLTPKLEPGQLLHISNFCTSQQVNFCTSQLPITCSSCSTFVTLFPGLTKEEEVLEVLCILDTNTFQVEPIKLKSKLVATRAGSGGRLRCFPLRPLPKSCSSQPQLLSKLPSRL